MLASMAVATWVEGACVVAVLRVTDLNVAETGE